MEGLIMKIIAIEHELTGAPSADFQKLGQAEAMRVWELTQANIIRESYFRADVNEAVLVLECASLQAADDVLSTLPFVASRLIRFELIPLRPYPGFARLFTDQLK
jgi:hypothetical protein